VSKVSQALALGPRLILLSLLCSLLILWFHLHCDVQQICTRSYHSFTLRLRLALGLNLPHPTTYDAHAEELIDHTLSK
jgi:hypothetical protein